ncbi:MAG TPA: hypothetical protein VF458_21630, partial [Ktedonobacteraceae bacterium]
MPTLEERVAALEKDTKTAVQNINHELTVLSGVMGSQGQDIKRILLKVDSLDEQLGTMGGRLGTMGGRLDTMDGRLGTMDGRLDTMDGRLDTMDGRL